MSTFISVLADTLTLYFINIWIHSFNLIILYDPQPLVHGTAPVRRETLSDFIQRESTDCLFI